MRANTSASPPTRPPSTAGSPPTTRGSFFSAGVLGAVTYTQDATWAYTGYAGYTRILGSSGDSPLVRRPFGDPNQFLFGLKVDYLLHHAILVLTPEAAG